LADVARGPLVSREEVFAGFTGGEGI